MYAKTHLCTYARIVDNKLDFVCVYGKITKKGPLLKFKIQPLMKFFNITKDILKNALSLNFGYLKLTIFKAFIFSKY